MTAPDYDTVIVLDSHWFTTVEFIITSPARRAGLFTAEELPRGMCRIPYEWRGDPELATAIAAQGEAHGTWITAIDDPYLPLYYPSINMWSYLGKGLDKQWISLSVAQTGDTEDYLRVGRAIGAASLWPLLVAGAVVRRVLVLPARAICRRCRF